MTFSLKNVFHKIKTVLFPIEKHELKRFIPMALMMLFILFNYTVLRNVKDTLVVNAKGSDESVISFLKLFGTTPTAILFMLLYTKMANIFSREKLFYIFITFFLAFFGLFAFAIYPQIDLLHPNPETVYNLQEHYPYISRFLSMWGNWSYCLFYVLAELWGSVMLSLMFWQFANEITKTSEAKRFYPLYGFVGNIGLVVSGYTVSYMSSYTAQAANSIDPWHTNLKFLMSGIVISGFIITFLYYWMNRKVMPTLDIANDQPKPKKKKPKLSVVESLKLLFTSPYLLCIAILVLSYGITINYLDVLWKGQVKLLVNKDNNAFSAYMGSFSSTTGWIALPLMLLGGNILRKFSWKQAAAIAPIILLITGGLFYSIIVYGNFVGPNAILFTVYGVSVTAVGLAAQIGYWQGAVTKASKYSLFDATKEMAYIPLDNEMKSKGKAAVDVAGARMGKSGGALTFTLLQTLFPLASTVDLAPILAGISVVILGVWFASVGRLSKSMDQKQPETKAQTETNLQLAEAK